MTLARRIRVALITAAAAAALACSGRKPAGPAPAVPVTAAAAQKRAVPVEVHAIGHVEPYSTVSIRSQIGGTLVRVAFREGQVVRKGDPLFTIDRRPYEAALSQARANLDRDQATARNAAAQASRYAELVKKDYVTQQQYDDVRSQAASAEATVKADEAAVENARVQLSYCTISAPISGRTGSLLVHEGNVVKANDDNPLVVINQIEPIYVAFSVPEPKLPEIQKRSAAGKLQVIAQPEGGQPHQGRLTFIDNSVNSTTGTIDLKGTFPNADQTLWPGQFVNVTLQLAVEPGAIVIPTPAVQSGQSGSYVYIVKPDQTVELRPVVVDRQEGALTVIAKGVQAGETVVTDGQLRLREGSKVEVKAGGEEASS
jgi:multidrug efflux system membrane fusion protein